MRVEDLAGTLHDLSEDELAALTPGDQVGCVSALGQVFVGVVVNRVSDKHANHFVVYDVEYKDHVQACNRRYCGNTWLVKA